LATCQNDFRRRTLRRAASSEVTRGSNDVLDDVLDKETGPKPKLVSKPGNVGSVVRHAPQADLDAYINGQLFGARLDFCRTHLDSCEECRAALEDLRNFKSARAGLSVGASLGRELDRRKRQKQLKAAATAATVAAVVAAVAAVGWNEVIEPRMQARAAAAASQSRGAAPAAVAEGSVAQPRGAVSPQATSAQASAIQSRGATPAAVAQGSAAQPRGVASTPAASTQTVANQSRAVAPATVAQAAVHGVTSANSQTAAVAQGSTAAPQARSAVAAASAQRSGTSQPAGLVPATVVPATAAAVPPAAAAQSPSAAPADSASFALLGPFGDEISDDRPEFTWQPVAGAAKYSVILVDEGLRPIAHTRVKTTTWRPHKPLRRGRTYLWQVTAILKNGTKIVGTGPKSAEARIHIAPPSGSNKSH
jgi:hypothetical protein